MPKKQQYNPEEKEQPVTAHERRMYNQYAKHALATGGEVENMKDWVKKRRKQAKTE